MSRYCVVKTQFKDCEALIKALRETGGWTKDQIEIHDIPQHLYGYTGDQRTETANIIIRRQHVGRASNDIGFIRNEDGHYEAIISAYDVNKYGSTWIGQLRGNYAYHKIRREQESRGRMVSRTRCPSGRQRIEIRGYR